MSTDVESTVRSEFARIMGDLDETELDLGAEMVSDYGLTSMNRVLLMISLCDKLGVNLANFTEADLAALKTLRDVVDSLAEHRQPSAEEVVS